MSTAFRAITAALLLGGPACAIARDLPARLVRQLPAGYVVLGSASSSFSGRWNKFYFVALGARDEIKQPRKASAPARPLLIYKLRADGSYALVGRNDHLVLRADEGGQCDPFEGRTIATKGPFFTIENGVACGEHWTDNVTFRFDPNLRTFVFDNWRFESWTMNTSNKPNAQVLVSDGRRVLRAKGRAVPFTQWRRPQN